MEQDQFQPRTDLDQLGNAVNRIRESLSQVVIGQQETLNFLIVALLADGHVLIEGVPGVAKTLSAKLLARSVDAAFSRIQFTPDLMPSDVLGTPVFNPKTTEFEFRQGPIFGNMILIDEINRAPAKTQAALFEVMEERQVTIDGQTYLLQEPFMVLATQNPIEQEGTYRLPEAQLDRFLFKIEVPYPALEDETAILRAQHSQNSRLLLTDVAPVLSVAEVVAARKAILEFHVEDHLLEFIARIVHETRNNPAIYLGASPRASLAIVHAAKAYAAIQARDFITPEDVIAVAQPVLAHRILISPEKEMEGLTARDVIAQIIKKIEIPR
ncbi:magnesium chelatase [Pedobacter yulinensis]|uniref:Magnesium chelatase n=1 Tax=Pedobacter yulinensis TaxID=2126353 RepID=A0A2T3HS33_9SPHI|nr:MoxR family ATPase [Pedobacter yulinensis]PST85264.1 magnesium chelatase [Pedobacter yulinensis]